MGVHNYLKSLSDLEGIYRCPGKFKYQEHSVASHSFKVTKIAQLLATVEEMNGATVDWKLLFEKAINHDYTELFTGDIKTPVKYALPKLKELFSQVEETMTKQFLEQEFPPELRAIYEQRFRDGKDETLEGKILAVSDKIDLLYEAFGEIQKGNPEPLFLEIYTEALTSILQFRPMSCVTYFLQTILPDMIAEEAISGTTAQQITNDLLKETTEHNKQTPSEDSRES